MIYLIAGRPRSGKSYEAVKYHVLPALKSGRKVITNLPLNIEHIKKFYGQEVSELVQVVEFNYSDFNGSAITFPFSLPEHYEDDWKDEQTQQGALFVIDEAHFSLPKGGTHPSVKKYYTMHGHYGVDILLMTQHPRQLDADILNLVEVMYRTIKNTALGSSSTYTKKVQDGYRGHVVNQEQRRYDKSVFPFYKSHTQSKNAVAEATAKDIKPVWRHWSVYGAIAFLPIAIFLLSRANLFSTNPEPINKTQPIQSVSQPQPQPQKQETPLPQQTQTRRERLQRSFPFAHPFEGLSLHITGNYHTRPDQSDYVVTIAASRNGQVLFETNTPELLRAGYELFILNSCAIYLQWSDFSQFVTCDSPSVSISNSL